jgi:hypothetical protein
VFFQLLHSSTLIKFNFLPRLKNQMLLSISDWLFLPNKIPDLQQDNIFHLKFRMIPGAITYTKRLQHRWSENLTFALRFPNSFSTWKQTSICHHESYLKSFYYSNRIDHLNNNVGRRKNLEEDEEQRSVYFLISLIELTT